jgi:endoribonuclease Dicer
VVDALIFRFLKGETNVLVASDVLEEGIDIQKCNLVVKFDMPKNYRSYVQSKGRARQRSSKYYMLVPRSSVGSFNTKYNSYRDTEKALQKVSIEQVFTFNQKKVNSFLPF